MPIVINEIEINVEVTPGSGAPGNTVATASTGAITREDIVKECVEKVMEILNQKNER